MCIFGCDRKENTKKYALGNSTPYVIYDCKQCTHLQSKIFYFLLKWFNFCGKFSFDLITDALPRQLIELGYKSKYIVCKICKRKFELEIKNKEIFVYEFPCSHSQQDKKPCFCCRKLSLRKSYRKCKKCEHQLLFINQQNRVVQCPKCNLSFCEFCQKEESLFSTSYCHCKVEQASKRLKKCKYLMLLSLLIIILALVGAHILEQYSYFDKGECTLINLYYKQECTYDELFKTLKFGGQIFMLMLFIMPFEMLLIEEVKNFFKFEDRLLRAKRFMAKNYQRRPTVCYHRYIDIQK